MNNESKKYLLKAQFSKIQQKFPIKNYLELEQLLKKMIRNPN